MIEEGNTTTGVQSTHLNNVLRVVAYCENVSVCRRKMLVEHFGEVYDEPSCRNSKTPCDEPQSEEPRVDNFLSDHDEVPLEDSFENFHVENNEDKNIEEPDDVNDSFDDFESAPISSKSLATIQKSSSEVTLNQQRHDMHGRFRGFLQDDSEEFNNEVDLLGADMNEELYSTLKSKFGFNQFRHRQKQCILSTLMGHYTFVLMPTGAGKSLCYQLPAVILPEVTVVVSPLRSLIEDRKMKMKELGIGCEALTADLIASAQEEIYSDLSSENPTIKLLYVTPEKISASGRLSSVFYTLHRRGLLARFVIDEEHCVSQWGHDFRPDYTKLNTLREKYNKGNTTTGVRSMHLNNVLQVVAYCENVSVCRRKMLVEHFGEVYDEQSCRNSKTPCDICERQRKNVEAIRLFDVSTDALSIIQCLPRMQKATLKYISELYRGALIKKTPEQAVRII
ncbi:unnamed protein product [Caenorhabditis brenneri]